MISDKSVAELATRVIRSTIDFFLILRILKSKLEKS